MTGYENRLSDVKHSVLSANLKGLSYRELQNLAKEVRSVTNRPIKLNSTRLELEVYISKARGLFNQVEEVKTEELDSVEVLTNDINGYAHEYTNGNLSAIRFGYNCEFNKVWYSKHELQFTLMTSCDLPLEVVDEVEEIAPTPKKLDLTSLPSPNDLVVAKKVFSVTTVQPVKAVETKKRAKTPKVVDKPTEGKVRVTYKKPDEYTYKQSDKPCNYSKVVDHRLMNERIKARKEGKTYSMNPLFSDLQQTTKSRLVDTGHKHPKGASVYVSPTKVITYK